MSIIFQQNDMVLRLAELSDAEALAHYFVKNQHYLEQWEPKREPEFYTAQGWTQRLTKLIELQRHSLAFYWVLVCQREHQILGVISLGNISRFPLYSCNVGYSLDENAQGRGLMRTMLSKVCQWGFKEQNFHRIMANYMPHNYKSGAVLKAVGFEQEGMAKAYLLINGQWQDHILTSLINHQWEHHE